MVSLINGTWVSVQQPYHEDCSLTHRGYRHLSLTWPRAIIIVLPKSDQIESESISLSLPDIWNWNQGIFNPRFWSRWESALIQELDTLMPNINFFKKKIKCNSNNKFKEIKVKSSNDKNRDNLTKSRKWNWKHTWYIPHKLGLNAS